jgi:hypothetical protein
MKTCDEKMGGENFLEATCRCGREEGHTGQHVCIHGHKYLPPEPPALQEIDGKPVLTRPQSGEMMSGWLP